MISVGPAFHYLYKSLLATQRQSTSLVQSRKVLQSLVKPLVHEGTILTTEGILYAVETRVMNRISPNDKMKITFMRYSFYSELSCQVARGGTEGRGAAAGEEKVAFVPAGAVEKPMGGVGKVGDVGVVGDIVADFVFLSFTAGGTFS